jgi:hypothetical protein
MLFGPFVSDRSFQIRISQFDLASLIQLFQEIKPFGVVCGDVGSHRFVKCIYARDSSMQLRELRVWSLFLQQNLQSIFSMVSQVTYIASKPMYICNWCDVLSSYCTIHEVYTMGGRYFPIKL